MAIHLEKYGFSVLTPPKCGSTSLKRLAFQIENGREFQAYVHNGTRVWIHNLYRSRPFDKEQHLVGAWSKFCIVRNPVSRLVSCFSNRVKRLNALKKPKVVKALPKGLSGDPSFEEFVENLDAYQAASPEVLRHSRPLSYFLGADAGFYDRVFDLSELQTLHAEIERLVGEPIPALPHDDVGGGQWARPASISTSLSQKIKEIYAEDISVFGAFFKPKTAAA